MTWSYKLYIPQYIDIPYIVYIYIYSPLGGRRSRCVIFSYFFFGGALGSESRDGCRGLLALFYCCWFWWITLQEINKYAISGGYVNSLEGSSKFKPCIFFWNIWIGFIMNPYDIIWWWKKPFMFLVLFVSICKYASSYFRCFWDVDSDHFFQGGHAVGKNPNWHLERGSGLLLHLPVHKLTLGLGGLKSPFVRIMTSFSFLGCNMMVNVLVEESI